MEEPCYCLAMLMADKVIREEGSGKFSVVGIFHFIFAESFPVKHDAMHLYLALTDGQPGEHEGKLRMVYIDDGPDGLGETLLCEAEGPLVFPQNRLETQEMSIGLRSILLPKPGTLDIRFCVDGREIASRRLRVVQIKKKQGDGADGKGTER